MTRAPRQADPLGTRLGGRAGFTLIELLISSLVMVGVLTTAYLCLQAGLESRSEVARRADIAQTARVVLRLLAADLRHATILDKETEFLGMERTLPLTDDGGPLSFDEAGAGEVDADNLDFATHAWTPRRPGERDFCEVSWFVDRSIDTPGFSLFRRRDSSPDDRPLDGGTREEIASGVRFFRLEFYDGYTWHDTWGPDVEAGSEWKPARVERPTEGSSAFFATNLTGLPEAVRVTLRLCDPEELAAREERSLRRGGRTRAEDPPVTLTFRSVVRLQLAPRANLPHLLESISSTSSSSSSSTSGVGS